VCTALLVYSYIEQSSMELYVQLYWCTVIYSTGNRELGVQLYWCTVVYSTGNRELCVQLYWCTVI